MPGSRRIIGSSGLPTHNVSYSRTHHMMPPSWAFKTKVSCGVVGCRRKPTAAGCFGCGAHHGMECSNGNDEDVARDRGDVAAGDGSSVPPIQQVVTCSIPALGTTLYKTHYEATSTPQ